MKTLDQQTEKKPLVSPADRVLAITAATLCTLLLQALLTAWACSLTESLLDVFRSDLLGNTAAAVAVMALVGSVFLSVDFALVLCITLHRLPRKPVPRTRFTFNFDAHALAA